MLGGSDLGVAILSFKRNNGLHGCSMDAPWMLHACSMHAPCSGFSPPWYPLQSCRFEPPYERAARCAGHAFAVREDAFDAVEVSEELTGLVALDLTSSSGDDGGCEGGWRRKERRKEGRYWQGEGIGG